MNSSDTNRLEAFSDCVFSIAISLLVLEIKVPGKDELLSAGGLWSALGHRWPNYLGYVLSFLVIGVMWANHHALFEYIKRVDRPLIVANLLLPLSLSIHFLLALWNSFSERTTPQQSTSPARPRNRYAAALRRIAKAAVKFDD